MVPPWIACDQVLCCQHTAESSAAVVQPRADRPRRDSGDAGHGPIVEAFTVDEKHGQTLFDIDAGI
jgi:hypothetical protein